MHAVSRGAEPPGLAAIRRTYTPRWIAYYRDGLGNKPTDTRWRAFEPVLRSRFLGLCGYCEELCKGEVDHFRPKKTFPERVYQWTNWIYSCHTCNNSKGEKWASRGYVNPCCARSDQIPELFFYFDTATGEIVPRKTLSEQQFTRANQMRDRLQLNAIYRLKKRVRHLEIIEKAIRAPLSEEDMEGFLGTITARDAQFSSLVRQFLTEQNIPFPE